jgi:hypothetical protein
MQAAVHQQVAQMKGQSAADDRAAYELRVRQNVIASAARFAVAHADVVEWLATNFETNDFAAKLAVDLDRKGFLTPGQVDAVRRSLTGAPARAQGTEINVGRIEEAFDHARETGLKRLRLHLDTFKFKPAGENSANAGGIYVTEGDTYLGKVLGGKFLRSRECSQEQEQRIVAAAGDPAAAAKAFGQRTGQCCICGRELTAEESIERFIGPICASKYGF